MHIAAASEPRGTFAFGEKLRDVLDAKARNQRHRKNGRTHLQDATPLTVDQEFGGWVNLLDRDGDASPWR